MTIVSLHKIRSKNLDLYMLLFLEVLKLSLKEKDLLNLNPKDPESLKLYVTNLINQPVFVVIHKNKVIGFISFGFNTKAFSNLGYIRTIAVDPKYRGVGLGKLLIKAAIANLKRPIWIMTKRKNKTMQNLLKKLGFKFFFYDPSIDSLGFILL